MVKIEKAAVIGAGTMGAGIASHLANAGVSVVLLDVVAPGSENRSAVAEGAVSRLLESSPPAFMHRDRASLITPGNVEDHLHWLADADWIAEAVVERLDVKRALYQAIAGARKPRAMVSSNTSTIPLSLLTEGMADDLAEDFCITHFFNPVRYMRLLEMVAGPATRPAVVESLAEFCDVALGKGVVHCRDTPGFLANRVGCYALQVAMIEALDLGLTVEEADLLMGRPMGLPKTGVFGLYDLIGLDLMLDVASSLRSALPGADPFAAVADGIALTHALVNRGLTGLKGSGGFYRTGGAGDESVREAVDLVTGKYRPASRPRLEAAAAGERDGIKALVSWPDRYGEFAWRVLARTLSYAAALVPEVAEDPVAIDEAMKLGYNWSRGPFEMIDDLGIAWFRERLESSDLPLPEYLRMAGERAVYRASDTTLQRLGANGQYSEVVRPPGVVRLSDLVRIGEPIACNAAASLWDVGEGVACLEFHTKANALVPESMAMLRAAVDEVESDFQALVIHNDAPHFSVGVNLEFVAAAAREEDWERLDRMLIEFQSTCKAVKYAPFPVVGAPSGLALGGGFEVLLHCDLLQAHANTTTGLVETIVGLVPSGGGCKELLHRWTKSGGPASALEAATTAFRLVGTGRTASSPEEARPLKFFRDRDRVTMNRDRLLAQAKSTALELVQGYAPPAPPSFTALGKAGHEALLDVLGEYERKGVTTPHDLVVCRELASMLCGGDRGAGEALAEDDMLDLERAAFIRLAGTAETRARIDYMLSHGRPLRN